MPENRTCIGQVTVQQPGPIIYNLQTYLGEWPKPGGRGDSVLNDLTQQAQALIWSDRLNPAHPRTLYGEESDRPEFILYSPGGSESEQTWSELQLNII